MAPRKLQDDSRAEVLASGTTSNDQHVQKMVETRARGRQQTRESVSHEMAGSRVIHGVAYLGRVERMPVASMPHASLSKKRPF